MTTVFGGEPVRMAVEDVLARMAAGDRVDSSDERQHVDLKEEHGRRDRSGAIGPSKPHNEQAAAELAAAAACMANTPGGGALIVGVADDGQLVGTDLDAEWLRHRMWELSGKALTVDVQERDVRALVRHQPGRRPDR